MRLDAIFQHFGLPWAEAHDRIHLLSGVEGPFITVRRQKWNLQETGVVDELIEYIQANNIDLVVLDPLVESHEADENNNTEMSRVMRAWKRVASITGAAVLIVHHSRKPTNADLEGSAGRADVGRGASAVPNAARIALTLFNMTEADAKACGVPPDARHLYVRLDDAKMNLGLASSRAEWFERKTVRLANGEELGVLAPARFATDERRAELRLLVVAQIEDAKTKGKWFSASPNATNPNAAAPYPPAAWRTKYPELFGGYQKEEILDEIEFQVAKGKLVKVTDGETKTGEPRLFWVPT